MKTIKKRSFLVYKEVELIPSYKKKQVTNFPMDIWLILQRCVKQKLSSEERKILALTFLIEN